MIKKHLVTCSVMLVLVIVSKLFICSTTDVKPANRFGRISRFVFYTIPSKNTPSFADEALPLSSKKVNHRLARSMKRQQLGNYKTAAMQRKVQNLFAIIEPILKLYGIPEDFKYVPLVESSLHGEVSSRGATGVWQFMPQTAREYGLKVDGRRDERQNIHKSTIAACKYIKDLYTKFNSWTLAAAAYNCGSPRVRHAINRKNHGNYFAMRLNGETGSYVYKLVAVKQLFIQPNTGPNLPNVYAWLTPAEQLVVN